MSTRAVLLDGWEVDRIDPRGQLVRQELASALERKRRLGSVLRPDLPAPSTVYFRLDANLGYGTVVALMQQAHAAGYPEVSFVGVRLPP